MPLYGPPNPQDSSPEDSWESGSIVPQSGALSYGTEFAATGAEIVHGNDFGEQYGEFSEAEYGADPDYSVGGMPAQVNTNPYVIGVVDPSTVDSKDYNGAQVRVRRRAESNAGPVGYYDLGSQLAAAYAQSVVEEAYEQNAQLDVIMGI